MRANHLKPWQIAQLLAGELSPGESQICENHTQTCPECAFKLSNARREAFQFASAYPTLNALERQVQRRHPERESVFTAGKAAPLHWLQGIGSLWGRLWERPLKPAMGFAILLFMGLAVWRTQIGAGNSTVGETPLEDLSPKGKLTDTATSSAASSRSATHFVLFLNRTRIETNSTPHSNQSDSVTVIKVGDTLQIGLVAAQPLHYAVFYSDDQKPNMLYFSSQNSEPLGSPDGMNLPHSLVFEKGFANEKIIAIAFSDSLSFKQAEACAQTKTQCGEKLLRFEWSFKLNPPVSGQ